MRLTAVLVAVACLAWARPAAADGWTGPDKAAHFGLSMAFSAAATALVPLAGGPSGPDWRPLALGAGLGLVPGLAKESWDAAGHGDASAKDMAWNVAGVVVGAVLVWTVQALAGHPAR